MTDHDAVHGAAELALGLLSGPERAEALAHLDGCAPCRTAVEELADVADTLLLLAPEAEPPAGFETGVLARADAPPVRRRSRRLLAVAAVVVLLLAAAGVIVMRRDEPGSRLDREYVAALEQLHGRALAATALQDASGRQTGQLFLYEGDTSWIFATVADRDVSADLAVELRFDDGRRIVVPGLRVSDGYGSLGATVDHLRLRDLGSVRVVDAAGRVRYTVRRP